MERLRSNVYVFCPPTIFQFAHRQRNVCLSVCVCVEEVHKMTSKQTKHPFRINISCRFMFTTVCVCVWCVSVLLEWLRMCVSYVHSCKMYLFWKVNHLYLDDVIPASSLADKRQTTFILFSSDGNVEHASAISLKINNKNLLSLFAYV